MKAILGKDVTFVPFFTEYILLLTVLVVSSLIVSISSVILYHEFGKTRCFDASSVHLVPPEMEYLGLTNGVVEIGTYSLYWRIEYFLPLAEGIIESITINGPIDGFGVNYEPNTDVVALTICGGEISCQDMESKTCTNEGLPGNCGIISGKRNKLDKVTPDTPIPGGSTEVGKLAKMLRDESSLFYIIVKTTLHPNGAQRANLDAICRT